MAILGRRQKAKESEPRLLDVAASMQGSLVFQESVNLRISGRFEGTLETRGNLTVGERALVQADITGEEITVAGRVTGKVVAKRSLRLVPPAVLTGEIWTPVLQVEPGARLEGSVHMAEEGNWMTLDEVAEYLEIEIRLLEQWAGEGKIPGTRKTGQWQFERAKIDEWVATQKSS
ncbi:MAG: polymer-forming cytoskeletal protein [Candidatus Omnitrophica bacterium]|nr:polymer-forming cytoskeletal protein [Candidatus Omnitrophota bacterium]